MKIGNGILSVILLVLFVSLVGNFIQYTYFRKEPVFETVIEIDTLVELDTIFIPDAGDIFLPNPEPIFFDSVTNIVTHRDTFLHQYG